MKFSLSLLANELGQTIVHTRYCDENNIPRVIGLKMLEDATLILSKDYLYFGRLSTLKKLAEMEFDLSGMNFVVYGCHPAEVKSLLPDSNYFVVTAMVTVNHFINLIETVFATYYAWENRLLTMSISESSLQEMLDCAYEKIKVPMCILDINHAVQALIKDEDSDDALLKAMETGYGYRFVSVIQDCNPTLEELDKNDVTEVISNISGNRLRVATIRAHGRPAFYLGLHKPDNEPFKDYTIECYELLTNMLIQKAMSVPYQNLTRTSLFGQFASDLIGGAYVESTLVDKIMEYFGFSNFDSYRLIGVDFPASKGRYNVRLAEFIRSIESEVKVCKCFYIDSFLGILIPDEKTEITLGILKNLLKDYSIICAVSNPFDNIIDISRVWSQIMFMLSYEEGEEQEFSIRRYDNYIIKSCSAAVEKKFPIETLYNQVFLTLKEFDRENQTEYVKTLITYLQNNCSITDTAAKLFIHRNSMRYRITKIEELIGFDVTESDKIDLILFTSFFVNYDENEM